MTRKHAPTLADVAKQAGVSLATASRALHGGGDRVVSPELVERVLRASSSLQYTANAHAQALARDTTASVGVVVHDIGDPYFSELASGAFRVAAERELLGLLCSTGRDPERELEYVGELRAQRVQAVVLAGSGFEDDAYKERMRAELELFVELGGAVAVVSRHDLPVSSVMPDNRGGARMMARHLVELGHRRIAIVAGPRYLTTVSDRLAGALEVLRDAGIEPPADRIVQCEFNREGAYRAAEELIARDPTVTAIFALNDVMAVGVLAALREHGVAVPAEVSVAGFDDIETLRDVTPGLTTVRVDMRDLGARAMEVALDRSTGAIAERHPVSLVTRDSTGSPRDRVEAEH